MDSLNSCIVWRYEFGYNYDELELKMVWHYFVDAERGALEYLIIEFSYKSPCEPNYIYDCVGDC